jgi:hypothetical protein
MGRPDCHGVCNRRIEQRARTLDETVALLFEETGRTIEEVAAATGLPPRRVQERGPRFPKSMLS